MPSLLLVSPVLAYVEAQYITAGAYLGSCCRPWIVLDPLFRSRTLDYLLSSHRHYWCIHRAAWVIRLAKRNHRAASSSRRRLSCTIIHGTYSLMTRYSLDRSYIFVSTAMRKCLLSVPLDNMALDETLIRSFVMIADWVGLRLPLPKCKA